jgi:hypothetical protein
MAVYVETISIRHDFPDTFMLQVQRADVVVKVKLSLCLTNKALCHEGVWRSGCIDPHFLDLGANWR